jgi:hypothetical protein
MPLACFQEVEKNRQRRIPTRGIRRITKILWFLGSRPTDLARAGGMNRPIVALVEAGEVEEDSRAWDNRAEGSPRWIRMDLGGTLVVMADLAVTMTLSLDLEVWVRAVEEVEGSRVVEVVADEMEGTGVVEGGEGMEGGMKIVIVIAITMREATIEVVGAVTVNVGEVAGAVVVAVVGDTEPFLVHVYLNPPCSVSRLAHTVTNHIAQARPVRENTHHL